MGPFEFSELAVPDERVRNLFRASFGSPPPDFPRHYVALQRNTHEIAGYVHYTEQFPGIFLCGGLCVQKSIYRNLTEAEREVVQRHGSLSRWLLNESIDLLPGKIAVFAYTGRVESRRDGLASGFVPTSHRYLIVRWHQAPPAMHADLTSKVAALGPF